MIKTINSKILKIANILLFSCFLAAGFCVSVSAAGKDNITIYSNIYNASQAIDSEFTYEITPDSGNLPGATNEPTTVTVTASDISVYQQARNLTDGTKGNLNFNHEPEYSYIRINLTVIGDEMDKQEYFKFKVFIDSLCMGCKYDILGQDEYVKFEGNTIKTADQYTVFARGGTRAVYALQKGASDATAKRAVFNNNEANRRTATYTANGMNHVYLKHDQSITIGLSPSNLAQIPVGTLARVMNDQDLNLRKWTMYIDGVETREFEHIVGREIDFNIVLERNMLVPNTGLFLESLPYLLLAAVGAVGLCSFLKLKARYAR